MKTYCCGLFVFFLLGLFSFSEGKPCPERTKPHKTRCDIYYKCAELSSAKHVWVPTRCEDGLVYEHSLTVCVLPADDWDCLMGDHKTNTILNVDNGQRQTKLTSKSDADIYIVTNAEGEDISLNSKNDESKLEIIIGPDISDEDLDEGDEEELYDGSGNGSELVELDGLMPAQNRETEIDDIAGLKKEEEGDNNIKNKQEEQKIEQKEEMEEIFQVLNTKVEMGQPSKNIDPKLTAHLQRLSQLIDGLKQTYQTPDTKPQDEHNLRPDQLNAFLAHFNIKNKFDSLNPSESFMEGSSAATTTPKPNRTLHYKHEWSTELNPETKVVLSNMLPYRYGSSSYDNGNLEGGYSNSQIVVNRPEGSVHFSLPGHHYTELPEYYSENAPKISEETLKTVLELSKQMIAQQNVPKVIPNPAYFAPPIMQPILLTPHVDSPFSTNYISQNSNSLDFSGQYNNVGAYNQNLKYKKIGKRPYYNGGNNDYNGNDNDNYETVNNNGYSNNIPGTTVIHNNLIPVHLTTSSSGEKEVLDSYGQTLGLYPPLQEERPDTNTGYHDNANSNSGYSSGFQNNKYSATTTKRPSYVSISPISSPYGTTPRPFDFQPTSSAITQYFTPSEHLGNHNVNKIFSSIDIYGSIPRPMKDKNPNFHNYKPLQENTENGDGYSSPNQLFPQVNNQQENVRPNYQNNDNENTDDLSNNYQVDNNDDESQLITYTYGHNKKPGQQTHFTNYDDSGSQTSINTVFSTNNNPYIPKPQSNSQSSSSYYSSDKNKYRPISSPLSSTYGEGTQLVNVGGHFISFDVFQNSILPLVGNNAADLASSLNNVEVITCATGVRQPNTTDCTRYYVCSKKDGKVLSYSCPLYTAFNSETRICDAKTYAMCSNDPIVPTYSVSENKRKQMDILKAIQESNRRQMLQQQQQQAIKAQNMANFLQQYNPSSTFNNPLAQTSQDSSEQNMLNSYMQQAASMSQPLATTTRPQLAMPTVKKRKYYCKEGDKIADQTSIYNYFVCYKNAKGQMKGHKMTCSKGLIFCSKSTMCTLPSKCS